MSGNHCEIGVDYAVTNAKLGDDRVQTENIN